MQQRRLVGGGGAGLSPLHGRRSTAIRTSPDRHRPTVRRFARRCTIWRLLLLLLRTIPLPMIVMAVSHLPKQSLLLFLTKTVQILRHHLPHPSLQLLYLLIQIAILTPNVGAVGQVGLRRGHVGLIQRHVEIGRIDKSNGHLIPRQHHAFAHRPKGWKTWDGVGIVGADGSVDGVADVGKQFCEGEVVFGGEMTCRLGGQEKDGDGRLRPGESGEGGRDQTGREGTRWRRCRDGRSGVGCCG